MKMFTDGHTDGQTDARLITISPRTLRSGGKKGVLWIIKGELPIFFPEKRMFGPLIKTVSMRWIYRGSPCMFSMRKYEKLSLELSMLPLIWMDGWMTCDFTSFSTVFQSYQDDGRLIMKGCVQWNSIYG